MELKLKMYDSRNEFSFDTETPFINNAMEGIKDYYYFNNLFMFYEENDNVVAIIDVTLFDAERIYGNGLDIYTVADVESSELYEAADALWLGCRSLGNYFPAMNCYISTFWVAPEFRKRGIGKYLLRNLEEILEYYTNVQIQAIGIYPRPMAVVVENNKYKKEKLENEDCEMQQLMIKLLKSFDYRQIKDSNHYVKDLL